MREITQGSDSDRAARWHKCTACCSRVSLVSELESSSARKLQQTQDHSTCRLQDTVVSAPTNVRNGWSVQCLANTFFLVEGQRSVMKLSVMTIFYLCKISEHLLLVMNAPSVLRDTYSNNYYYLFYKQRSSPSLECIILTYNHGQFIAATLLIYDILILIFLTEQIGTAKYTSTECIHVHFQNFLHAIVHYLYVIFKIVLLITSMIYGSVFFLKSSCTRIFLLLT